MPQAEIDKGTVVKLKSGGPPMTVRALSGSQAYCEWFTDTDRRFGTFELSTLVPVPQVDSERPPTL